MYRMSVLVEIMLALYVCTVVERSASAINNIKNLLRTTLQQSDFGQCKENVIFVNIVLFFLNLRR